MNAELPSVVRTQLNNAISNFDEEKSGISITTFMGHINRFRQSYLAAEKSFTKHLATNIKAYGVAAFRNQRAWAEFEWAIYRTVDPKKLTPSLRSAVQTFRGVINDYAATSPSTLVWKDSTSSIVFCYAISSEFTLEIQKAHKQLVLTKGVPLFWPKGLPRSEHTEPLIISGLKKLVKLNHPSLSALKLEGLKAFRTNPHLVDTLINAHSSPEKAATYNFLSQFVDSEIFQPRAVTLACGDQTTESHKIDLRTEFLISPSYYDELKIYAEFLSTSCRRNTSLNTSKLFGSFWRTKTKLTALLEEHSQDLLAEATTNGYRQLLYDNQKGLRRVLYSNQINHKTKKLLYNFLCAISDQKLPTYSNLVPYIIPFDDEGLDGVHLLSCQYIYENYPILFGQLQAEIRETIKNIDLENFVVLTLRNHMESFQRTLMALTPRLGARNKDLLALHGIDAFKLSEPSLQTIFFQLLQEDAQRGTKARQTIVSERRSFVWVLTRFGVEIKESFPIPINRYNQHKQRLREDDYFKKEECLVLALGIERELRKEQTSISRTIQFLLARVFLKTGWNLSDVLRLKINDISQTPRESKVHTDVRLQKARAGYKTTHYLFSDDELDNGTIKSAANDLIKIKSLTDEFRSCLPNTSNLKDHLLLIKSHSGNITAISKSFTSNIKRILLRAGCDVGFNTKKIRKGYSNAMYREARKNFREYESKGIHSVETFLKSYHRIEEQNSIDTLSIASETIVNLLSGKPYANETKVKLPTAHSQATPAGFCGLTPNAEVPDCSDFNICPFCKYHRLVADRIHVWKCLSHIEHINESITPIIINPSTPQAQMIAVAEALKEKIHSSLEQIKTLAPEEYTRGKEEFNAKGMHPDWQICNPPEK